MASRKSGTRATVDVLANSAFRSNRTPLGDEEDRDEHAETHRLELDPELRVGQRLVAVDQHQQCAGRERAEDGLETHAV